MSQLFACPKAECFFYPYLRMWFSPEHIKLLIQCDPLIFFPTQASCQWSRIPPIARIIKNCKFVADYRYQYISHKAKINGHIKPGWSTGRGSWWTCIVLARWTSDDIPHRAECHLPSLERSYWMWWFQRPR